MKNPFVLYVRKHFQGLFILLNVIYTKQDGFPSHMTDRRAVSPATGRPRASSFSAPPPPTSISCPEAVLASPNSQCRMAAVARLPHHSKLGIATDACSITFSSTCSQLGSRELQPIELHRQVRAFLEVVDKHCPRLFWHSNCSQIQSQQHTKTRQCLCQCDELHVLVARQIQTFQPMATFEMLKHLLRFLEVAAAEVEFFYVPLLRYSPHYTFCPALEIIVSETQHP